MKNFTKSIILTASLFAAIPMMARVSGSPANGSASPAVVCSSSAYYNISAVSEGNNEECVGPSGGSTIGSSVNGADFGFFVSSSTEKLNKKHHADDTPVRRYAHDGPGSGCANQGVCQSCGCTFILPLL